MITIIVPFKNSEEWLGRCLESLHNQKGDFQFIIVNDHSDDNGKQIAEEYAENDYRFEVYDNAHTPGVSGARNTGLDHVENEWFTFLDADDELHHDATMSFIKTVSVDANMHQLNHLRYYQKHNKFSMKSTNAEGWYNIEHLPITWCMVWNKLYKTSVFGDVRFIEGLQYGEDEAFNIECFDIDDKIYHSRYVGTIHRFDNQNSLSKTKGTDGLIKQTHALEELLQRCKRPEVRKMVCYLLAEHWSSQTFLTEFVEKGNNE